MTAEALVASRALMYLGLERKLIWPGRADSSVAAEVTSRVPLPTTSAPISFASWSRVIEGDSVGRPVIIWIFLQLSASAGCLMWLGRIAHGCEKNHGPVARATAEDLHVVGF